MAAADKTAPKELDFYNWFSSFPSPKLYLHSTTAWQSIVGFRASCMGVNRSGQRSSVRSWPLTYIPRMTEHTMHHIFAYQCFVSIKSLLINGCLSNAARLKNSTSEPDAMVTWVMSGWFEQTGWAGWEAAVHFTRATVLEIGIRQLCHNM